MFALLLVLVGSAHAETLTVGPSDSATHTTIQSAIDAADSGDTIHVEPGTYAECIDFSGKSLNLQSTTHASMTVIDGTNKCADYTVRATDITSGMLDGFTVTHGRYGGIRVSASEFTMQDTTVRNVSDVLLGSPGMRILPGSNVSINASQFYDHTGVAMLIEDERSESPRTQVDLRESLFSGPSSVESNPVWTTGNPLVEVYSSVESTMFNGMLMYTSLHMDVQASTLLAENSSSDDTELQ